MKNSKFDKLYKTIMEDIYDYDYNRSNELSDQTISVDNPMPIKPIKNNTIPASVTANYGKRTLSGDDIDANINFRNCDDYIVIAYYCILHSVYVDKRFFEKLVATSDIVTKDTMQQYTGMNEVLADVLMKTLLDHGLNLKKFSTMTDDDLEANDIAFSDLDILIGILEWHTDPETDKPLKDLFIECFGADNYVVNDIDINAGARFAIKMLRQYAADYEEPLYV